MVPSLKFTLIAWLAIIGFALLSFVVKDKKDTAGIRPSSSAAYTHTQNQYAGWSNTLLCTPRNAINGNKAFVGSDDINVLAGINHRSSF